MNNETEVCHFLLEKNWWNGSRKHQHFRFCRFWGVLGLLLEACARQKIKKGFCDPRSVQGRPHQAQRVPPGGKKGAKRGTKEPRRPPKGIPKEVLGAFRKQKCAARSEVARPFGEGVWGRGGSKTADFPNSNEKAGAIGSRSDRDLFCLFSGCNFSMILVDFGVPRGARNEKKSSKICNFLGSCDFPGFLADF